ncbi:MAG: cysteine--tRNA ligase [Ktedonobacterales bacterium]|nr:cysteine--tRNA ligase [Ktedonobacterales bacterium]
MRIYNTETKRKETFEATELPVKMYVCGLTPKNEPHLGHARLFVVNDTVRRYLEFRGYPVRYIQNFTDIDDKIIAAGQREGIPPSVAARRYTESYFRDMGRLNVRQADEFTYVTEFIPHIIEMVRGLITREHAYVVDGDVYFSVPSFPHYGRLSGRDEEAMLAGARIEPDERKHDPRDFALWKSAKPGEPWWESPWGNGRPGWHIECSTMAMRTLGEQVDIHGGGSDLIFPHHENEIAQSESYSGVAPFARYWLHTGMLSLGSDKMAHSGTFVTIRSVLASGEVPPPALRTYLLGQHYRANLVYSDEQVRASVVRWQRWAQTRETLLRLIAWAEPRADQATGTTERGEAERRLAEERARIRADFIAAMDDDFNTSGALSALDELAHRVNDYANDLNGETVAPATLAALRAALAALDELAGAVGISLVDGETTTTALSDERRNAIEALVTQRAEARARRDWAEADRIRQELDERYAVVVKDTPQGPTWLVHD